MNKSQKNREEILSEWLSKYRCIVTKPEYLCPNCGHDILVGRSQQVSEDSCEMWLECDRCHFDPSPEEHVETIMGWDNEFKDYAKQIWLEKVCFHKSIVNRQS